MVNTVTASQESDTLVQEPIQETPFNLSYERDKKQLQEMHGWTTEQIDIIMEKNNKDIAQVLVVINHIMDEYNKLGPLGPWEKPTTEYLFKILSSAEERKEDPFTILQE